MPETLGEMLIRLRGKMSLREASQKSGLSHTYIRDMELGKSRMSDTPLKPTPEALSKISKAYNCSYEELLIAAGYVDADSIYSAGTKRFIKEVKSGLTAEEIMERNHPKINGVPATKEQVEIAMKLIQELGDLIYNVSDDDIKDVAEILDAKQKLKQAQEAVEQAKRRALGLIE